MIHNLTPHRRQGVDHLRHRLHPGDSRRPRQDIKPRAADLDGRAERRASIRCSTSLKGSGANGQFTYPKTPPTRTTAAKTEERVDGRPRRRARRHRRPPAPRRPARRPLPDAGRRIGRSRLRGQGSVEGDTAHLFQSEADVLRARGRGVVGRGHDRRPAPTGRCRSRRATCCRSRPPTTSATRRGTSRWAS